MINLNKQRIAVYMYLLLVFSLIFGLSFSVQGNKITGSFILEIADNVVGKITASSSIIIILGFLVSLVFSLFILRHAHEIKKDIRKENIKYFAGIVIVLLAVSFLSFGVYFGGSKDKITGFASLENNRLTDDELKPGLKKISEKYGIEIPEDVRIENANDNLLFKISKSLSGNSAPPLAGTSIFGTISLPEYNEPEWDNPYFINNGIRNLNDAKEALNKGTFENKEALRREIDFVEQRIRDYELKYASQASHEFEHSKQGSMSKIDAERKAYLATLDFLKENGASEALSEDFVQGFLEEYSSSKKNIISRTLQFYGFGEEESTNQRIESFFTDVIATKNTQTSEEFEENKRMLNHILTINPNIEKSLEEKYPDLYKRYLEETGKSNSEVGDGIIFGGTGDNTLRGGGTLTISAGTDEGDKPRVTTNPTEEGEEITKINDKDATFVTSTFTEGSDGKPGFLQVYKADGKYYVFQDEKSPIEGRLVENNQFVEWDDNGLTYRLSTKDQTILVQNEIGEFVPSIRNPETLKTTEKTTQKITNTLTYEATSILLKLTLGRFADDAISDYCKEQYDSSDYEGGQTAANYNANTQSLLAGQTNSQAQQNNCIGNQTTLTAQGQKSIINTGFTYQTSWTITPCKENVQYTIYLANSIDDNIGIATGVANKGIVKSESKQFSYTKNYQFVCIQISDTSVGDDGYACFNVV